MNQCDCIMRADMPQIDAQDLPAFFDFCRECGVEVVEGESIDPKLVRGRQEINRAAVRAIVAKGEHITKPVLLSTEPLILDGNHRWMACIVEGVDMPCDRVMCSFGNALQLMYAFPKTYRLGDGNTHPMEGANG